MMQPLRQSPNGHDDPWVAIVDDDLSVRRALERVLRMEGIRVGTFCCAHDYIAASVTDGAPACLVLDVHLGATSMSGFDLHAFLSESGNQMPIILMTAHDDVPSSDLARRVGRDNYLRKPFERADLIGLVRRALHGSPAADSGDPAVLPIVALPPNASPAAAERPRLGARRRSG